MMTEETLDGMEMMLEATLTLSTGDCLALVAEVRRLNAAYAQLKILVLSGHAKPTKLYWILLALFENQSEDE